MNIYRQVLPVLFLLFPFTLLSQDYPFLNHKLTIEERVNDLLARMTLEEKISQMMNDAPAIERLGIPQYNWWSEGLHGVARAGLATVFPQAIGLAASWDEEMMLTVAEAISDEARAKHHNFAGKGKRFIYQGLTIWSPNINIFRDPRWGRGQETFGEDPFLTGRLAVQFIRGLQGDDPDYYKTIATVKHFAVHSGPEPERHHFDAVTGKRIFNEFYLPQFEMGIKEGGAYSAMCAYNRYNGEACCGSDHLLNGILRNEWGFEGYIVSDCGAIRDIYQYHKIADTPEEAAAIAVKSGTDLNCGAVYKHLAEAVDKDLITEEEIDIAVKRLFTARFKLGMFDPPEIVNYTKIPYSVLDSDEHKQLALEAARKSIVLLKNEKNILPLSKDVKSVAVIGPNSDQWLMLLGNYNGVPSDPVTPLRGIKEKLPGAKIIYAQGCNLAEGMPLSEIIPEENLYSGSSKGLKAEYFDNRDLKGTPLYTSVDKKVDFNWSDKAPRDDMDDDNFGVRWTGEIIPGVSGTYRLGIITSCKASLYLGDSIIAKTVYHFNDEYGDPRLRQSSPLNLEAGKKYEITIEAGESFADAQIQLVWEKPQSDLKGQAIEAAKQSDAVIMFMGLTARMEGEEMDVNLEGFRGGDRTKLDLPEVQLDLIKSIYATGKPVVLVLLNGSALAVNWENENIPAIVEAWYPGQAAGTAIADVLFGDYNPAGRLPVTFYKSVDDLPPFEEYEISNQTYRYFEGEPLYPFGYGLSYTTFKYDSLSINNSIVAGRKLSLSVNVTNTGEASGEEVIQVYVSGAEASFKTPLHSLKGFKRVHLMPGETKRIAFDLPEDALASVNDEGEKIYLPGEYSVYVGGGQPGSKAMVEGNNYLSKMVSLEK